MELPVLRSALKKYACELTLDPNTVHRDLSLSDSEDMVMNVIKVTSYPDHPDRFDSRTQVLCRESLTGRCYWEVEWNVRGTSGVHIGVTYRGIARSGWGDESGLGWNDKSWSLYCSDERYCARYNRNVTAVYLPPSDCNRVGVYVDQPAGTLSFYRVSPDRGWFSEILTHIHTFQTTFTQEDLLPGFEVWDLNSSVSLCQL